MSNSNDDSLRPATKLVQGGRRAEWTGDPRLGGERMDATVLFSDLEV